MPAVRGGGGIPPTSKTFRDDRPRLLLFNCSTRTSQILSEPEIRGRYEKANQNSSDICGVSMPCREGLIEESNNLVVVSGVDLVSLVSYFVIVKLGIQRIRHSSVSAGGVSRARVFVKALLKRSARGRHQQLKRFSSKVKMRGSF